MNKLIIFSICLNPSLLLFSLSAHFLTWNHVLLTLNPAMVPHMEQFVILKHVLLLLSHTRSASSLIYTEMLLGTTNWGKYTWWQALSIPCRSYNSFLLSYQTKVGYWCCQPSVFTLGTARFIAFHLATIPRVVHCVHSWQVQDKIHKFFHSQMNARSNQIHSALKSITKGELVPWWSISIWLTSKPLLMCCSASFYWWQCQPVTSWSHFLRSTRRV